jgi:5-methylcytosine-specific restriction endonuclease McrA
MTRALCGTESGYTTHRNANEEPCLKCKEAKRLKSKIWREQNREKHKASIQKWADSNRDKIREKNKKYIAANPESRSSAKRKRRALEKGAGHFPYSLDQVLEKYGTNCHLCSLPIDLDAPRSPSIEGHKMGLHIDHLIPLSKGGQDNIENVRPSHAICNMTKGARIHGVTGETN